jgi:hypothetical protein
VTPSIAFGAHHRQPLWQSRFAKSVCKFCIIVRPDRARGPLHRSARRRTWPGPGSGIPASASAPNAAGSGCGCWLPRGHSAIWPLRQIRPGLVVKWHIRGQRVPKVTLTKYHDMVRSSSLPVFASGTSFERRAGADGVCKSESARRRRMRKMGVKYVSARGGKPRGDSLFF